MEAGWGTRAGYGRGCYSIWVRSVCTLFAPGAIGGGSSRSFVHHASRCLGDRSVERGVRAVVLTGFHIPDDLER